LGSSLEFENNTDFWFKYITFIKDNLKDISLAKAMFEQKLLNSK
jgi:hypothetical protein